MFLKELPKKERMVFAILENVQRDDLNCVEEALAYYRLISELKVDARRGCKKTRKSRASISNLAKIFKITETGY